MRWRSCTTGKSNNVRHEAFVHVEEAGVFLLLRGQHELVPVRIVEGREGSPRLFRGFAIERHAPFGQFVVRGRHIIGCEDYVGRCSDPVFLSLGREQHESCLGSWNT